MGRKKSSAIKSVKVGAYDISIRWVNHLYTIGDKFGLFDSDKLEICICNTQNSQGKKDAVIHEVNHAIWYVFDIGSGAKNKDEESTEEYIVRTMATGWLGVIKDNPKLLAWLCD